ncbi:PepSY domain-containing protein [Novosphingobium sp. 1949]|uniref:PepSY domain-containing protein n=1 Tax=Novosphingobium organovorum TaxID=2930092 RepID=A0ABT0BC56_9SPHN|nr:PepSY domain-containing protein [Novosphingobium organovorum]MCJ2182544.1 PepSY domain-containing protein [Novosphingobium organovorum]
MASSPRSLRIWSWLHTWSGLACTGFLLLLCLTGLPLIFHQEIDALTRAPQRTQGQALEHRAANAPDLDAMVRSALDTRPGWKPMFLLWDDERPLINLVIAPSLHAQESEVQILPFDARSGARLTAPPSNEGVMAFLLDLHSSLLLGPLGTYFLALIGLLFALCLVSGVVVYAPFMRHLAFGSIRKRRSARIKWLDGHNMVGMVTLGWLGVVTLSGILLTLAGPIQTYWKQTELADMVRAYKGQGAVEQPVSANAVHAEIRRTLPDARIAFIAWPDGPASTAHHFMVALSGDTPLTSHTIEAALVDARSGRLTRVLQSPWYLKALFLSIPLHFGDYASLPLKIIWALFDLAAILLLGTGLYLWGTKRARRTRRTLPATPHARIAPT